MSLLAHENFPFIIIVSLTTLLIVSFYPLYPHRNGDVVGLVNTCVEVGSQLLLVLASIVAFICLPEYVKHTSLDSTTQLKSSHELFIYLLITISSFQHSSPASFSFFSFRSSFFSLFNLDIASRPFALGYLDQCK